MAKRILVIGSSNMDLSLNVYRLPSAGETVIDDGGVAYTPGGKGANAAISLRRLGADTVFCTKLGADSHGQKLYGYFKDEGLDTSYIKVDRDFPTGFAAVIKESDAQNRIIYYPGANTNLTRENLLEAFSCSPDAVYLNFEISFEAAMVAAKIAASRSIPVFIDAAPASADYPLESLPPVEIFSPNESETKELTGILPAGADSSLRAALALWKRVKCKYIIIKQGSRGVFVYDGKHYSMIPAFRADKVVDTTAAGDAFGAAMLLEYLSHGDVNLAVKYGAAAGAVAVSRAGAATSVPTASEVLEFIRKRPNEI
ncbi:MAG: ribokinase [Clostridia bacterium]|nr:ribokinase [Clostridia bacterium]